MALQLLWILVMLTHLPTPSLAHKHPNYHELFTTAAATAFEATKPQEVRSSGLASLKDTWPSLFSPTLFQSKLLRMAEQLAQNASLREQLFATPNITETCQKHVEELLTTVVQGNITNIITMIDAMGKPAPDMELFNLNWPGAWKECRDVTFSKPSAPEQTLFTGEYCVAHVRLANATKAIPMPFEIAAGICVPDSCSGMDIKILINSLLSFLQIQLPKDPYAVCQTTEEKPLDMLAIGGIVVVGVFAVLVLVGTGVDLGLKLLPRWRVEKLDPLPNNFSHSHGGPLRSDDDDVILLGSTAVKTPTPGFVSKLLISFSLYTNGSKLLSTERTAGSLDCVHGLRFFSMTWVVLGHTFLEPITLSSNLIGYLSVAIKRWTFQAIMNATVSVDSFFVLSGLLVSYLSLKELRRNGGNLNWFKFYFHRFWRLTPPYLLIIFMYLSLGRYWASGPLSVDVVPDRDNCQTSWWTNLLYVNNFVHLDKPCLGQSWYLANDMQFYVLSPLIFVPFYFSSLYGIVSAMVFLLATTITPAVLTMKYGFSPGGFYTTDATNTGGNYMQDYYVKPYNRMGPYVIGMVTGYLLYRTDCKLKINRLLNIACWVVATATALAIVYGLYHAAQGHPLPLPVSALYNSVARTAWGLCVAWVIFACVTGNGGFVNTLLSWKALVPLSRLTYCIYLLHIMILAFYGLNRDTTFYYSDANLVVLFLALLVVSYMVSAVVSLTFEAPMMALEKVIFTHFKWRYWWIRVWTLVYTTSPDDD